MSTRCLASGPVMLPSPRRLPRPLRTELPALARQPWQTCTGRTGSGSRKQVAPSADPSSADLPHRGPRTRVAARSGSGRALPQVPRRRLVRTRTTLPWFVPWDAHPRAPLMMRLELSLPAFSFPVAPCPSKGSPRQQPHRVTAAVALSPADCASIRHPCCHERWGGCSQQTTRPCSTVEFVAVLDVAIASGPFLPWACVPSRLFAGFANAKRRSGAHLVPCPGGVGVCAEARRVRPDRHDGPGHESPKRLGPDLRGTFTGSRSTQVRSVPPSPGDESPFAGGDFIGSKPPKQLRSSR
jgi:hypothetical protein